MKDLLEDATKYLKDGFYQKSIAYSLLFVAIEISLIRQQFGKHLQQQDKLLDFCSEANKEVLEILDEKKQNEMPKQLEFDFMKDEKWQKD